MVFPMQREILSWEAAHNKPRITFGTAYPVKKDIAGHVVDRRLLRCNLDATRHGFSYELHCAMSGHHTGGTLHCLPDGKRNTCRALDWGKINEIAVSPNNADARVFMEWLATHAVDYGITELGGPWIIKAKGVYSFTNDAHKNHIHAGVGPREYHTGALLEVAA